MSSAPTRCESNRDARTSVNGRKTTGGPGGLCGACKIQVWMTTLTVLAPVTSRVPASMMSMLSEGPRNLQPSNDGTVHLYVSSPTGTLGERSDYQVVRVVSVQIELQINILLLHCHTLSLMKNYSVVTRTRSVAEPGPGEAPVRVKINNNLMRVLPYILLRRGDSYRILRAFSYGAIEKCTHGYFTREARGARFSGR